MYELKTIGAFKEIKSIKAIATLERTGIVLEEILNDSMTTIDEVVKKKLKRS